MRINLTVIEGPHEGREFTFQDHDNFIVGRAKVAHFRLPVHDKYFSRIHFMVEINPPLCRLLEMGSTNGTSVNGRKVKATDLHDGDLIKAGKTVIRVSLQDVEGLRDEVRTSIRHDHLISESPQPSSGFEHAVLALPPEPVPVQDVDVETDRCPRSPVGRYSGSRSHDTLSGVPKPTEDILVRDLS